MEGKYIIACGPVLIEDGCILLIKDKKDNFYKLPGGTLKEYESPLDACIREVKEEINGSISIIKPLSTQVLWENPETKKKMTIILIHFLSRLNNKNDLSALNEVKEIRWINISEIKDNKHKVAPNILFLIEKKDI